MRLRPSRLRVLLLIAVGVVVTGATLAAYATHALKPLQLSSVDARFSIRGARPTPRDVTVVEIDDKTFNDLKAVFPFPRGYHARVITQLAKAGAKVIAYDVQFTEPSADPAQDNMLVEATRAAGNVVLATTEVGKGGTTRIFGGGDGLRFSRATPSASTFPNDAGGTIRRTAVQISGLDSFPVAAAKRDRGTLAKPPGGPGATPWIDFNGPPGTLRRLSFSDVLRGHFPPDAVRGRIVVVGASSASLQDLHPTSTTTDQPMPGPEIQAEAIDTVMRGYPLRSAAGWVDVLLIVVFGFAAPLAMLRLGMARSLLLAAVMLAALAVAAQLIFNGGRILQVVYPLLAGAIAALAAAIFQGIAAAFERERVRDAFARFVPESVVDDVLAAADGIRLGGVRRDSTVLFSDLRSFTSFAENLEPDRVIEVLNRYLTAMSDAILDQGGTLVAYMGDGIMAVFGAPIVQEDHADRAVAAAREMLRRLEEWNAWLRSEGLGDGFRMGIGLNSGPVMSGNVGSERRLEYTAIGDTTNTAARLEGMTKGTPHQLYVAGSTYQLLRDQAGLVRVGQSEVRGRVAGIELWSLSDADAERAAAPPASSTA